jgi:hypothetical protein
MLAGVALTATVPAASAQEVKSVFAGADPDIEFAEGKYWIYPTGGEGLAAWSSADKLEWMRGELLLRLKDISWVEDDRAPRHFLWAPDMVQANGGWYFYYSVGPQNPTPSRIGVAVCKGPAGPCTDSGKPLITGGKGFEAIDPAVFVDPKSKTPYLYAGGSAGATLRVWALKPDMVSLDHEVKVDTPPNFTEGAFMHYRKGIYYLSYSAGKWDTASYQVHYAVSLSPTGPWRYGGRFARQRQALSRPRPSCLLRGSEGRQMVHRLSSLGRAVRRRPLSGQPPRRDPADHLSRGRRDRNDPDEVT